MKSRISIQGHSLHRLAVKFPVAFFATSPLFDIAAAITGDTRWYEFSFLGIGVGLIAALVAMVIGLIDWTAIPEESPARLCGAWHGMGMACAVSLYVVSWSLRFDSPAAPSATALIAGGLGLTVLVFAAYQGAEIVSKYGLGIPVAPAADAEKSPLDPQPDFEPSPPLHRERTRDRSHLDREHPSSRAGL